jgi:hypothetical protein
MYLNIRRWPALAAITILPTLLIWLPFFLRLKTFWTIPLPTNGMATIVANYDGPLFLVVAKTIYNSQLINNFPLTLPSTYYAAHFPLFPLLIKIPAFLLGYPYSMLAVTVLTSFLAIFFFNKFISQYTDEKNALFLTLVFGIFPARWLIVRSVGSAEPLFIASIIASVYFFQNKKYLWAGIWGATAQLTKSPGILLFLAYLGITIIPQVKDLAIIPFVKWIKTFEMKQFLPIFLIPLALILVFVLYQITLGNFLAYFYSGDNIHLFFPPFQIFNYAAPWVGTYWLEEIIFIYLFGALGILQLIKQKESLLTWVAGIFFLTTLFVAHRDLMRYSLPVFPFLFVAFRNVLITKEFKIVLALLVVPIFLFSLAYISQNVMPIGDWAPFL